MGSRSGSSMDVQGGIPLHRPWRHGGQSAGQHTANWASRFSDLRCIAIEPEPLQHHSRRSELSLQLKRRRGHGQTMSRKTGIRFSGTCARTPPMADVPFTDPLAWRPAKAPSLDELQVIAEEAYRRLPDKFRALCDGLVIHVDDFPTDEVLDELKAETEFALLGLFQGVGLPFRSESDALK